MEILKGFNGELKEYQGYSKEDLYTPQESDYLINMYENEKNKEENDDYRT